MVMKRRTTGFLVLGTIMASTSASMTLSAKDLDAKGEELANQTPETRQEAKKPRPHMDLAFCIDTTGSMQAEIDMVKSKVKDLVAKLCSGKPTPIVRVGLVAFRDRGDEYVTKLYPFTDDVDKFVKDISELTAAGGGDGPEAVNQALHAAVNDLTWDKSNKTAKLLFLIGDAAPHYYAHDYKWEEEARKAIANGIQINTLGCDGLESFAGTGVETFKEIARLADGKFETLAYRQIVTDAKGAEKTIISSGGRAFEVDRRAKDEWKKGAAALASAGKARAVASSMAYADAFYAAGAGGSKGMSMATMGRVVTRGSFSRKDSNLDSLMYDAAMKRAEEKLKVDY